MHVRRRTRYPAARERAFRPPGIPRRVVRAIGISDPLPGRESHRDGRVYNSGSFGWVRGRMGEMAFLGTSDPLPGHDQPSQLGGDGQLGSPATGWPRYNRVAAQPADYVGPGQVAWFQFTVQAPTAPGVTAGATAGLQLNVTVTSGDFV